MKNKNKSKLERINLGFGSDEIYENPFSEHSENFRKKLKYFYDLYNQITSVKQKDSGYNFRVEGDFEDVKGFLDDITENNLIPKRIYPPASRFDKITDAPLNLLEYLTTGKKDMYFYTTKQILEYYKEILGEKGYSVVKDGLWQPDFDYYSIH